jgi:hypothetical protein
MAGSCPGSSYAELFWLQAWHIRDETYAAGCSVLEASEAALNRVSGPHPKQ